MERDSGIVWQPRYTLTPSIARHLMEIETARAVVEQLALPPAVQSELRRQARIRSTHYSSRDWNATPQRWLLHRNAGAMP